MGFSSHMQPHQSGKSGSQNVQQQPSAGKGGSNPPPMQGQQGNVTYPSISGQQQMGSPNQYPNTVGQWDNANIQPLQSNSGKGKGA